MAPPWKPDTARNEARRLLGEVVKGVDPSAGKQSKRKAATVGELCDAYLSDAQAGRVLTRQKATKKPSTLVTDRSRIERHIRPLLGSMKVNAVTRQDIEDFMHAIAQGKTAARIRQSPEGSPTCAAEKEQRPAPLAYSVRFSVMPCASDYDPTIR